MFSNSLEPSGFQGKAYKMLRLLLCAIPVVVLAFCIYWSVITGSGVWLEVIGGQLLAMNIVVMILAAISFTLMLFAVLGLLQTLEKILSILYFLITGAAIIFGFITMSFATTNKQMKYEYALSSYCGMSETAYYKDFCDEFWTQWSKKRYVMTRTTDAYDVFAGLISPWVIGFIAFSVMTLFINKDKEKPAAPPTTPIKSNEKVTVADTPLMSPAADDQNIFKDEQDGAPEYSDEGGYEYSA